MLRFLLIFYFRSFLRWIRCRYRYHCWKRRIQRSFCNWNVRYFQQVSFAKKKIKKKSKKKFQKKFQKKKFSNFRIFYFPKIYFWYFEEQLFFILDRNMNRWPEYEPEMTSIWPLTFREILQLTWWPLFRDCSFYIVSLLVLIWAFYDSSITWWVIIY